MKGIRSPHTQEIRMVTSWLTGPNEGERTVYYFPYTSLRNFRAWQALCETGSVCTNDEGNDYIVRKVEMA